MAKKPGEMIIIRLATRGEGLGERVQRTIKQWASAGLDEQAIIERLAEATSPGGTIYETVVKQFKNATGEAVDYVSQEAAHEAWIGSNEWVWYTAKDDRVCEDCAPREGDSDTWEDWEARGLPGVGWSVCDWRCRCSLEPAEAHSGNMPLF